MTKKDHEEIQRVIKEKHETGEVSISDEQKKRLEKIAGMKWDIMWIGKPLSSKEKSELTFKETDSIGQ